MSSLPCKGLNSASCCLESLMSHSLRIILADDEPEIRDHFRRVLERLGHQVVAMLDNGEDLVSAATLLRPDLLISDVRMPRLDGDAAVREIWKTCSIPAILISAYSAPDPSSLGAGNCFYLSKPVRRNDLEAAILAAVPDV